MKVLFAASECVPFVKTGGLADVAGALPPVLKQKGVDVRVILPLYSAIPDDWKAQMKDECQFEVELCWRHQSCAVKSLEYQGVTFYFVENPYYFGRSYIYGMGGDEYERYGYFCRAVIDALPHLNFQPDVLHCHDWQTGMIPALLNIQYRHFPFYSRMKTAFTIHNLQYQGIFGIKDVQDTLGLGDSLFTADKLECYGCANYLKAGLVYADEITTVSPSYSDEIQTAYYGERLEGLLRARRDQLMGILNGIDVDDYDPEKDPMIYANYGAFSLGGKEACKAGLQRELGLHVDANAPVVGMVTRLSHQKGLDLVERVIRELMDTGIQLVVLGMGDAKYTDLFQWAETAHPVPCAAISRMRGASSSSSVPACAYSASSPAYRKRRGESPQRSARAARSQSVPRRLCVSSVPNAQDAHTAFRPCHVIRVTQPQSAPQAAIYACGWSRAARRAA